mgnify:CR=1 FL=1
MRSVFPGNALRNIFVKNLQLNFSTREGNQSDRNLVCYFRNLNRISFTGSMLSLLSDWPGGRKLIRNGERICFLMTLFLMAL